MPSQTVFAIKSRRSIRPVPVSDLNVKNMSSNNKSLEKPKYNNDNKSELKSEESPEIESPQIEESSDNESSSDFKESDLNNTTQTQDIVSRSPGTEKSPSKECTNPRSLSPSSIRNRKGNGNAKRNSNTTDEIKLESYLVQQSDNETSDYIYLVIFSLIICTLVYFYMPSFAADSKIQLNKKNECSFRDLKKSFPNQSDNLWDVMRIGIESILNNNPPKPGVYLFLHENYHSTKELIEKIANISSNCFDPNLQPIKMETEDFITNDYGSIIEKYKKNIKNGGVLIVANLNEIPPESAKALHAICDSYSPIVDKVIIFLTLTVNSDEKGQPLEIAENKLNYLWGQTIEQNELEPLITRVTDYVIRLK